MKKNLLLVVGVPRSGSTYFTSVIAKKINTIGYSEPIRDADLYGRNIFSLNYKLFGKTSKLLPYFIKNKISKNTFNYLLKPHQYSILCKETWRMHDGVDFPTESIKSLNNHDTCKIVGILRNPLKIIESVVNRNHTINYNPEMACKLIWNQHSLKTFFDNENISYVHYEQVVKTANQNYLDKFLYDIFSEESFFPFKSNNQDFELKGIGDERALKKNRVKSEPDFRLNSDQILFLSNKLNKINNDPMISLSNFIHDLT